MSIINLINVKDGIVSFKSDEYIWNAYGKENIDHENALTDEQWKLFVYRYGKYQEGLDSEDIEQAFTEFCEEESVDEKYYEEESK